MKFFTRLQAGFRQLWHRSAIKKQRGDLREFVYLDEVSVYSLIGSRRGPIVAQLTETEAASLQRDIGGSISAGAGIANAGLNSHILNNQTKESQVLRKSIVQTTFKELYEYEMGQDSLAIRPIAKDQVLPKLHSFNELITSGKISRDVGWIIDPDNIARGRLFELQVELQAEPIFRFSAVTSAILEILEEDTEIFGLDSYSDLIQMKSVSRILEKLLVGLVPIRGKAIDYCVVEHEEKEWIVHRRLLDELSDTSLLSIHPLFIVGVAEQALFWKDIRRILFSKAHYRVLCRVAQAGLQTSWTPIKLAQVFATIMPPEITDQLNLASLDAIAKMDNTSKSNQVTGLKQQLMYDALVNYAKLLANHYHLNITSQDLEQIDLLSKQHRASFSSQKGRREAFEVIAAYLIDRFSLEREPLTFSQYRAIALTDVGLDFSGNPVPLVTSNDAISPTASQERFLDSEFVAIYW